MNNTIPLTKKQIALINDKNYTHLNKFSWCAIKYKSSNTYYAFRQGSINGNKIGTVLMHQEIIIVIMGLIVPKGYIIDHIDRNGLNNYEENLRIVTRSINAFNSDLFSTNSSGIKGVKYNEKHNKWYARIMIDYLDIYLGGYNNKEQAEQIRIAAENYYMENFAKMKLEEIMYKIKSMRFNYFRKDSHDSENIH